MTTKIVKISPLKILFFYYFLKNIYEWIPILNDHHKKYDVL